MSDIYHQLAILLLDVEKDLRNLALWEQQPPTPEALASTQPFAVDTLSFNQWLQFIFLPRMTQLVEAAGSLPQTCGIAPMGEQFISGRLQENSPYQERLIRHLMAIDQLIEDQSIESP